MIALPTRPPSAPGTPAACPASLVEGTLVSDDQWGVVLRDGLGRLLPVLWPFGYAARRDGDDVVVLNELGLIVAKVGDQVTIGGGETREGWWFACPGILHRAAG